MEVGYTEMLGNEGVLSANVVVEGDFREGVRVVGVRWGGGLAVAEEGGNYYEILGLSEHVLRDDVS